MVLPYCTVAVWWVRGLVVGGWVRSWVGGWVGGWYLPAQLGGVDAWGGSGAWVMGEWVCEYNTGSTGVPACPLVLQAYHH